MHKLQKMVATVLCAASAQAAQNCISNGDFETDVNGNVSASINWGYAKSGNRYTPANWTLNDRNHMGLVNEGTDRHNVLDTLGAHSLAIERYTGTSNLLEAKQSFSIPAPGTYRLTLLYTSWSADTSLSHLRTYAQLIQPGGVVTNQLNNFTPFSYGNGLESLGSFMSDTPTLAAYGSGNDYTLSLYATDTYSTRYAYCIIDNVSFTLRTLVLGADETFSTPLGLEPHDMNLGADATLTYTPTTVTAEIIPSKVTFAAGAKIVFDMASATAGAYVLRTGGLVLPEGASDPLAFIDIANAGDYTLSLIEDGRTILVSKPGAVTSATWTGGGDPSVLLDAANWSAVPDASTFNITLGAAADWRGLGPLAVSPAATIDLNGNALKLSGLTSAEFTGAAIANSASGAAADLTIDVPAGVTNVNTSIAILGNIRLVKEGAGGFKASKVGQTYWGGTAVNGGTLLAGIHCKYRPFGACENLVVNGDFEDNNLADTTLYVGTSGNTPGWTIPNTSDTYVFNAYEFWTQARIRDPQYEFDKWALSLGKGKSAEQTFHVSDPGTYRLAFEYSTWIGAKNYAGLETTVSVTGGGETQFSTKLTPVVELGYRQFFGDVEIAEPGDYTLKFAGGSSGEYFHADLVSFARKCEIAVGAGATFDMNGREGCGLYSVFVAAGGTLMNSGSEMTSAKIGFTDVTIADNHVLQLKKIYPISGFRAAVAKLDLGGKTNSVAIPVGESFSIRDAEIKNGTFNVTSGGWLQIDGYGVDASTADLIVGSALRPNAPLTVRNYTARYNANYNGGSAALNVLGTFTPETAYFYGCTMQDGSTIDLSAKSGAWSTTSSFSGGKKTVGFAANATVNIEVGARELAIGDKVVSWTAKPPVENNVLFELVRNGTVSETQAFAVQDDGLYVKRAAEPAYATYDVASDAWKFYTESDVEVTDWEEGVTGNMQVRFASYAEYAALAATNLTPSAYVLTGNLTLPAGDGDLEMTAFPFDFPAGTTIDLNGRALKLHEAVMGGTKPFTVTSSVAGGVLVADVAGTVNNTAMSLTGHVKLLKTGAGTFTATKADQTYFGGTEVTNGVLKCGIAGWTDHDAYPLGADSQELVANGDFDEDSGANWNAPPAHWTRTSDGNWVGRLTAGTKNYVESALPVGKLVAVIGSKQNPTKASSLQQDITISSPGVYHLKFQHATYSSGSGNTTDVLLIRNGVETKITEVKPTTTATFATSDNRIVIKEAGTYTLMFRNRINTTKNMWNLIDNVSLKRCPYVKVTGSDATIDMNGMPYFYHYMFQLDGGVIANTGADLGNDKSMIRWVQLEDDSTIQLDKSYAFYGDGAGRGEIFLCGNTFTMNIASGKVFTLVNMTLDEGRVEIPVTTGTFRTGRSGNAHANQEIAATNVDFSVGCALNLIAPMDVRGYEALYEGTSNAGTAALNVFGTFRPVTSNSYGCVLQDGATLDLSGWQGAWPWSTTSAFTSGNKTATFADGATIKVKRGAKGGKVVSWETKPSNFDTLAFVRDPADERNYRVVKKDDGVYIVNGLTIIVR